VNRGSNSSSSASMMSSVAENRGTGEDAVPPDASSFVMISFEAFPPIANKKV
jgi:hypothetical protein